MAEFVDAGWTRHGWWIGTGAKARTHENPPTVLPPCDKGPLEGCAGCVTDTDRILGGRAVRCTRDASHVLGAPRCLACGGKGWHETAEDARADLAEAVAPGGPSAPGATNPATPLGGDGGDTKIGREALRARLLELFTDANRSGRELIDVLLDDGWTPPPTDTDLPGALHVDGEHGEGHWYVRILDEPAHHTSEEAPTLIDWTRDGRMVGVELLGPGRPDSASVLRAGLLAAIDDHRGLGEAIGLAVQDAYVGETFTDPTFERGTAAALAVVRDLVEETAAATPPPADEPPALQMWGPASPEPDRTLQLHDQEGDLIAYKTDDDYGPAGWRYVRIAGHNSYYGGVPWSALDDEFHVSWPLTPAHVPKPVDPVTAVLNLQTAKQLGYVRPSDEWVDGTGTPLPAEQQQAAHSLARVGLLPEFQEATRA